MPQDEIENAPANDTQQKDMNLYFDAMNSLEQENLTNQIINRLKNGSQNNRKAICSFLRYLGDAFTTIGLPPPPSELLKSIEFCNEVSKENLKNDHFVKINERTTSPKNFRGNRRMFFEYYSTMAAGDEHRMRFHENMSEQQSDPKMSMDEKYALGMACMEYIQSNVVFMTPGVYKLVRTAYHKGNQKYALERLPFLLSHRNLIEFLIKKVIPQEKTESGLSDWANVLFKREDYEDCSTKANLQILRDLLKVEFDVVPLKFYEE